MTTVHLFPNGQVERGTAKRPGDRPGFRWHVAYSEVSARGVSQQFTRREWYAAGKRDKFTCKFHDNEQAARAAVERQP